MVASSTPIKLVAPILDLHHYTVIYAFRCIVCLDLNLYYFDMCYDRVILCDSDSCKNNGHKYGHIFFFFLLGWKYSPILPPCKSLDIIMTVDLIYKINVCFYVSEFLISKRPKKKKKKFKFSQINQDLPLFLFLNLKSFYFY